MTTQGFSDAAFSHLAQVLEDLHEDDRHQVKPESPMRRGPCLDCGDEHDLDEQNRCAECAEGVG